MYPVQLLLRTYARPTYTSGVLSRRPKPVPPVVMIQSTTPSSVHVFTTSCICDSSSGKITCWTHCIWFCFRISRIAGPDLSAEASVDAVSLTVRGSATRKQAYRMSLTSYHSYQYVCHGGRCQHGVLELERTALAIAAGSAFSEARTVSPGVGPASRRPRLARRLAADFDPAADGRPRAPWLPTPIFALTALCVKSLDICWETLYDQLKLSAPKMWSRGDMHAET